MATFVYVTVLYSVFVLCPMIVLYRRKLQRWKTSANCWIKCIWWNKLWRICDSLGLQKMYKYHGVYCRLRNLNISPRELRKVTSIMSPRFTFSIDSMIRGYHVFKDLCTDPDYKNSSLFVNLSDP